MAKRRLRGERNKPWFWKARGRWYITEGKLKVAVRDRHGNFIEGADNEAAALRAWHEMETLKEAPQRGDENKVRNILELYLQDLERRGEPGTVANYAKLFRDFLKMFPG